MQFDTVIFALRSWRERLRSFKSESKGCALLEVKVGEISS